MQKMQATGAVASPSPPSLHSPQLAASGIPSANTNFTASPYLQQMAPMMQMGMGMNAGLGVSGQYGGQQGLHPQTQAMHQSVMRHPSPNSSQQQQGQQQQGNGQGSYMGF